MEKAKKSSKKTPKEPQSQSFYAKADEIMMKKKTAKKTVKKTGKKTKVAAVAAAAPAPAKKDEIKERSVIGLSFSDYADYKVLGGDGVHDPFIQKYMGVDIPNNYSPRMTQIPINVTRQQDSGILNISKFTASDIKRNGITDYDPRPDIFTGAVDKTQKKIIWPKYYQNPYQFQDMVYLQDIYANTMCGRIFDMVGFFALADGIRPKLRVKNESAFASDKEKQKALADHKWMIDELEEIERNVSTSNNAREFGAPDQGLEYPIGPISTAKDKDTPTYDTSLQKKWFAAFINMMMFGREVLVPRVDPEDNEVRVMEGTKELVYINIPKIMMVIHPRDIGFNYVDYMNHRLLGIQLNNSNWILRPDEMMFFEWMPDNPVYGSKFYGMSGAQSMMGSARTLRRIIEVDFPLIARSRWSGMYWLVFKRKGEGVGTSDEELTNILRRIELNGINATLEENPKDDFMVHKVDLDPKISELLETVRDLIHYMISQVGMPQGLLYGEQDLNRDTFKSKVASWTKGALKRYRQPFLDVITDQWYLRLAKTLQKQSTKWEEGLKLFEVVATVNEFKLDTREELLNALMILENVTGAWTDEAKAEFLEMEDLQQKIDPDKDETDIPPMPSGKGVKVTDTKGQEFGVSGQ